MKKGTDTKIKKKTFLLAQEKLRFWRYMVFYRTVTIMQIAVKSQILQTGISVEASMSLLPSHHWACDNSRKLNINIHSVNTTLNILNILHSAI